MVTTPLVWVELAKVVDEDFSQCVPSGAVRFLSRVWSLKSLMNLLEKRG